MTQRTMIAIAASILVLVMIVLGLSVIGSPMKARRLESDRERVERLNQLHYRLEAHVQRNGQLPNSLDELDRDQVTEPGSGGFDRFDPRRDPETGQSFEYKKLGRAKYQVCATFAEGSKNNRDQPYEQTGFHDHKSGRQCFQHTVNDARDFPPAAPQREPVPIYD